MTRIAFKLILKETGQAQLEGWNSISMTKWKSVLCCNMLFGAANKDDLIPDKSLSLVECTNSMLIPIYCMYRKKEIIWPNHRNLWHITYISVGIYTYWKNCRPLMPVLHYRPIHGSHNKREKQVRGSHQYHQLNVPDFVSDLIYCIHDEWIRYL